MLLVNHFGRVPKTGALFKPTYTRSQKHNLQNIVYHGRQVIQ